MSNNQKGFSLIELLLVVVILMIISSIAIPNLMAAVGAAENANIYSSLKTITSVQVNFYTANGRYGRLAELNSAENGRLGTASGNDLIRGIYTLTMNPAVPTDTELEANFTIVATKASKYATTPYVISIDASGQIIQIFP